jgi:hypothetical protein
MAAAAAAEQQQQQQQQRMGMVALHWARGPVKMKTTVMTFSPSKRQQQQQ